MLEQITGKAQTIARILQPACDRISIAGSIRRQKSVPNDIEIVCIPKMLPAGNALHWLLDALLEEDTITLTKPKRWGEKHRKFTFDGVKVDLFTADRDNWGYIYWLRTGPGDGDKFVMQKRFEKSALWKAKGGYIWSADDKVHVPDEQTMLALLGIDYLAPVERTVNNYGILFSRPHQQFGTAQILVKDIAVELEPEPQQLRFDFPNALIADTLFVDDAKPKKAPEPEAPWEWEKPWITSDNQVYIYGGYGDWHIYPMYHERARNALKFYRRRPLTLESERRRLNDYIATLKRKASAMHWLQSDFAIEITGFLEGDIHASLHEDWNSKPEYQNIPMNLIVPTQEIVKITDLEKWSRLIANGHFKSVDQNHDNIPIFMQFIDDPHYYIADGHHRWYIAKELGLTYIPGWVDKVPKRLDDCVTWWDNDDDDELYLVDCEVYSGYLSPTYYEFTDIDSAIEISTDNLVYTVPDVTKKYVHQYMQSGDVHDTNGDYARVICFLDRTLVLDGHHRSEAAKKSNRKLTARAKFVNENFNFVRRGIPENSIADTLFDLHIALQDELCQTSPLKMMIT